MTNPNKLKAQFSEGAAYWIYSHTEYQKWRRAMSRPRWSDKRRSRSLCRRQARWERDNDPQWYTTHRIDMEAVLGRRMGAGYFE